MKPTFGFAALVLVSSLLAACTQDAGGQTPRPSPTGSTAVTGPTGPAPVTTGPAARGTYEYANAGLRVVVRIDGGAGTMDVHNGTEHELDAPDLYVLDARDGSRIEGEVLDPTPIPAGERATFDVRLEGVQVRDIGLLILLFGSDNFGAFVRTA